VVRSRTRLLATSAGNTPEEALKNAIERAQRTWGEN